MNPDTGHLIAGDDTDGAIAAIRRKFGELTAARYLPVPEHLHRAAKKKLAGRDEAMVSLRSGGKLSKWAVEERAKRRKAEARAKAKKKARRKMEKATRRANR